MDGPQPTLAQLRPPLQLALDVAGSHQGRLPGRVRNLVRNRRLPPTWMSTIRAVLEEDEPFRQLVAGAAEEPAMGPLAWLWLTRPEGWSDQLGALVEAAAVAEDQDKDARRAAERISALEAEVARARADAAASSSGRGALEAALAQRGRAAERLGRELAAACAERDAALERAGAAEARVAEIEAERDRLGEERAGLAGQVDELRGRLERAASEARAGDSERAALQDGYHRMEGEVQDLRRSVGRAVERAATAARQLGDALAEAGGHLAGEPRAMDPVPGGRAGPAGPPSGVPAGGDRPPPAPVSPGPVPDARRAGAPGSGGGARPERAPARRPLGLPPAVFGDSPEAAAHLVRAPGAHLVVDGYNVTFTSWAGDDLPGLRHRLVTALSELAVRVQRMVTVVFDGVAEGGRVAAPPVARPWLRIIFSASSVEADEVIVAAVRDLDPAVPVVVATNDRRVRQDVSRLGANVLSVDQLLSVIGRLPSGP